jgi:CubicO group peptidase (beta-lactamase class C family)
MELSRSRLDRISDFFTHEVAAGKIPPASWSASLLADIRRPRHATGAPMTSDTIFRLYSMSKPITAVSALRCELSRGSAPGRVPPVRSIGAGRAGTYFWIDRQEDMLVLLMVQTPTERGRIEAALKNMVYGAFENGR